MKKIISLILALTMVLCLTACDSDNPEVTTDPPVSNDPAEPGYTITINGTEIAMHVNAADILAALGEPIRKTEEASCAFDGVDRTYFFGSFYLTTYPMGDQEHVFSLWLVDDSITTPEGAYIGMSQEEVQGIYGTEGYNGTNAYILVKGQSKLTIIVDDGYVSSIQYDAVIE